MSGITRKFKLDYPFKNDGKVYNEIVLREMTGEDEEYLGQPQLKKNYSKFLAEVVKISIDSVVGTDWKPDADDILSLPPAVIDKITAELRFMTLGDNYEFKGNCKECGRALVFNIGRDDIINKDVKVKFKDKKIKLNESVTIEGKEEVTDSVVIVPFSAKARIDIYGETVNREDINEGKNKTDMIYHILTTEDGKKIDKNSIKRLTKSTRNNIIEQIDVFEVLNMEQKLECPYCSADIDIVVNVLDFLQ
jgi:hypothetical protein